MATVVTNIGYGVCVGSWSKFECHVVNGGEWPRMGSHIIATSGHSSIAVAYNAILNTYLDHKFSAVILMHDDLEITDPDAEKKFMHTIAQPDVALVGVAGGRGEGSLAWWNWETVGHQQVDSGMLDFGEREGDVDAIEGSIMVFSRWAIENLRFDTSYPGFHGYDEIAKLARTLGKRVVVADVNTHHHVQLGFKSQESERQWQECEGIFRRKWGYETNEV